MWGTFPALWSQPRTIKLGLLALNSQKNVQVNNQFLFPQLTGSLFLELTLARNPIAEVKDSVGKVDDISALSVPFLEVESL